MLRSGKLQWVVLLDRIYITTVLVVYSQCQYIYVSFIICVPKLLNPIQKWKNKQILYIAKRLLGLCQHADHLKSSCEFTFVPWHLEPACH
ncbi:hypothetical protein CPB83DRAFT_502463 [Crepidotus variabilis]|uniref:Uncharacterized protein n=1 Tax=Crepidotus variabilis TaxID=179855 RepID=A0A9P6EAX1_9AGAR|nr:hypothetical protein CPB83DRAFT_502463 [Crepidotus variabilis]